MAEVIKQIKQKNNSSFSSPIYLGAEQRFVGALRGSNVDNLEEQYIIGVDCITTEEWNDTTHRIIKEFRNSEQSTSYYKLIIEITNEQNSNIANGTLTVSDFDDVVRTETLFFIDKTGQENKVATKTVVQSTVDGKLITKETIKREV